MRSCPICRKPITENAVTDTIALPGLTVVTHATCKSAGKRIAKRGARVLARAAGILTERKFPDLFRTARDLYLISQAAREE